MPLPMVLHLIAIEITPRDILKIRQLLDSASQQHTIAINLSLYYINKCSIAKLINWIISDLSNINIIIPILIHIDNIIDR
jgi:hypothetical protein